MYRFVLLLLLLTAQSYAGWTFWKKKPPAMMYGIEKTVYDSLTQEQQQHIINIYNGQETERKTHRDTVAQLKNLKKQLTNLEKEKSELLAKLNHLQIQADSQEKAIQNFLTVTEDLLEARAGKKNYRERYKREKFYPKITSIKRGFNSTTILLENDTLLEVSPFEKETIEPWLTGQSVELEKGEGLVFTLNLRNLDTENNVAVKIKETK